MAGASVQKDDAAVSQRIILADRGYDITGAVILPVQTVNAPANGAVAVFEAFWMTELSQRS